MSKEKILSRFPLLFDGAMGTYYREKSKNPLPECEMANIFDKEVIFNIHKEYLNSGADAIKTNTFGANTRSLKCSREVLSTIIESGYNLAKSAIDEIYSEYLSGDIGGEIKERFIFADIGPILYNSVDEEDYNEVEDEYRFILDKFIELGVKNFLFETLDEARAMEDIAKYIKSKVEDSFIITSFAINPDGFTRKGYSAESLIEELSKVNFIDALGFNCVSGPRYILNTLDSLKLPDKFISIMPNSSYPTVVNNRIFYSDNSSYYAKTMMDFISRGVDIIGGCCGTTPEHIEKISYNLKNFNENKLENPGIETSDVDIKIKSKPNSNLFYDKLNAGKKVIAVELDPPTDIDIEKYMKGAKILKDIDVDAVTIADCPVGRARIDSSLMAYKLKSEIGIDPVVHLTCRDRNLNATKALLLGLNIENIRNLIIVTGDPIPTAEKDEIKPVFNFNSRLLAKYISELNEKTFTNKMIISSGLNINVRRFENELKKAKKKEEYGVEVFYTQPVLSDEAIENLKIAKKELKSKIMGGIIPVVSYRNAVFMNEEISGIKVSDEIISRYEGISKEEGRRLAVEISIDYMRRIEDIVDGFYLITPFSKVDIVKDIINGYKVFKKR